jgi:hypothetical protein
MACERHRNALTELAAGAPAASGLETHLASCATCRAELAALRQALALADAELAELAGAEPSPDLAARIRHAVASAEPTPVWRHGWLWPATAVAATLLVALAVVAERGTAPAPEPRAAADATPGVSAGAAPPAAEPLASSERHPVASFTVRASRPALRSRVAPEPDVLVPPGQEQVLLRFVALVHREQLTSSGLVAAGQPSADLAEPRPIEIQPLEIVPLDPAEDSGT